MEPQHQHLRSILSGIPSPHLGKGKAEGICVLCYTVHVNPSNPKPPLFLNSQIICAEKGLLCWIFY